MMIINDLRYEYRSTFRIRYIQDLYISDHKSHPGSERNGKQNIPIPLNLVKTLKVAKKGLQMFSTNVKNSFAKDEYEHVHVYIHQSFLFIKIHV